MKIQTFSIIAGSAACNARCPFCISKMTPPNGVEMKEPEVNWRNFKKACQLAKQSNVTTAMITSKGEPTLFPDQITKYLEAMQEFEFPIIELQSNGILIYEKKEKFEPYLQKWYELGLTTYAISIVDIDAEKNREIYLPYKKNYIDLAELIKILHDDQNLELISNNNNNNNRPYSVRLSTILAKGFIDNSKKLEGLINFAKANKVEQLSVRPVNKPEKSIDQNVYSWTDNHGLEKEQLDEMLNYVKSNGNLLMNLMHGAQVYDIRGQNICLTNCLTIDPTKEELRQLIFFPDGHLRYDWQYEGAIII